MIKKSIVIFIVLSFSLLYYLGFLTQEETLPFSKEFFAVETPVSADRPIDLKGMWASKLKRASSGNTKEIDQLYQLKLDKGIRNLPVVSTLLIREAGQAREQGNMDQAVVLANYSIRFSPDLPEPYFELARAYWHQNPFHFQKVLPQVYRGLAAQLSYYPRSLQFFYNLLYILSNAILMTFIAFGIMIMAKYLPLYFYDIRKNLTLAISALLINSAKILVLFIPVFLRLDMLWAILFWAILLWGYLMRRERQFILLFLIILVYLPFFLRSSASFLNGPSSDILLEMNEANHEDWDKATAQKLEAWLSTHQEDADVLFTLGLMAKREGRYGQAEELYQRVLQQVPSFSGALSNLGNVYLAKKQLEAAIGSYRQAIELNPNQAAYYFNLYRAYSQETLLSAKTSNAFEKARQLDPQLIDEYSKVNPTNINRQVIDEALTPSTFWRRFLTELTGREGALYRLFTAWFEKVTSNTFLVPLFFLGLLILMSRYSRAKRFLTRCPMCGNPTYRFYMGTSEEESICFNCHRAFVQKEKLHPKIAEKKSLQVRRFQRQNLFASRFLSFFFVGFADLWRGRSFKGLLLLFIFFIFLLRFFYWNGVMTSFIVPSPSLFWRSVLWGGLFILFYIFSVWRSYRMKPPFQTDRWRKLR